MPPKTSERKRKMDYDDVFSLVQEFGCYQKVVYFGSCLLILPIGLQIAVLVFAVGTPNFHCTSIGNSTCLPNKCCDNCTSYTFDGPFKSIVSEWNLICERAYLAATAQSVFMVGMLIGSSAFGALSDYIGRKKTIFLTSAIMVCSGVGSSFANSLPLFAFLRLIVGASSIGLSLSQYVLIIELVGPSMRTFAGKVQDVYWVVAGSVTALLAYLIPDWQYLMLACSLPAVIVFLFWRRGRGLSVQISDNANWTPYFDSVDVMSFPDSARWLVVHDRLEEAHQLLLKYGGKKGQSADSEAVMNILNDLREEERRESEKQPGKFTPLDLVRTRKLRRRSLIAFFLWFSVALSFYGFLLYAVNLSGNLYLNVFLLFLVDIPSTPVSWFLIHKFGRRIPFALFLLIGGGTCLFTLAVKDYPKAVIAITLIGKFFCTAAFSTAYLYTSELFPTVVRNIAVGTSSTCARIGSILAPYIVLLGQLPGVSITLPIVIIGIITIAAGVLSLWLPETLNFPCYQTIEEAEAAPESYAMPCCTSKYNVADDGREPSKYLI